MKMRKTRVVLKILPIEEIYFHHYSSRTTPELGSSAVIFYFELMPAFCAAYCTIYKLGLNF